MHEHSNSFYENLKKLKSQESFELKIIRSGECGTPALWFEEISYSANEKQVYETIRSPVDEGGFAIGKWSSHADSSMLPELIDALENSEIWEIQPESIEPGAQYIKWSIIISVEGEQASIELVLSNFSQSLKRLVQLDSLMRRVAYKLYVSKSGYQLNCNARLKKSNDYYQIEIEVENDGNLDCKIPNPFIVDWDETNYLSIEVAQPEDPNNPTGLGLVYEKAPLKVDTLDDKWKDACLELPAGGRIILPVKSSLSVANFKGHYFRGVYSCYNETSLGSSGTDKDMELPLLVGRAFSEENLLE